MKKATHSHKPSNPSKPNKKTIHKRIHLAKEVTIEEREEGDEVKHDDDANVSIEDQEYKDIPPPNPRVEPFLPIP